MTASAQIGSYYQPHGLTVLKTSEQTNDMARATPAAESTQEIGCSNTGYECPDMCLPCPPVWTVRADALFLHRSRAGRQHLVFEDDGANKPSEGIFGVQDLSFDLAVGPRLTLIRCLDECHSLELTYFGIYDWSASGGHAGIQHVQYPFGVIPFDVNGPPLQGSSNFLYRSRIHSTEVNLRRNTLPGLAVLAGFRWVELSEDVEFAFTPAGGPASRQYQIDTNNHLYGFQVGAEGNLWSRGPWRLDSWAKAGVYYNNADQTTNLFPGPFPALSAGASASHTAFLGEIGITGARQLTDTLALRGGYQLMWLEGVALAPDQLAVTDVSIPHAILDTHGGIFFHGFFVGLEAIW